MEIVIKLSALIFCSMIWLGSIVFLRRRKKKSYVYLIFFTIFYVYAVKVLDYTLFQYQSLLLMKYFMPNLILHGQSAGESINLIPLFTLSAQDLKTSLLNILLFLPFGFGLPFISALRLKHAAIAGMIFSVSIEILQFVSGLLAQTAFRIADVNDVIFNTGGAIFGYGLFILFMKGYRLFFCDRKVPANPVLQYISDRPQLDKYRR